MPSLKDIRARIASTKNTQKITSALKLVSTAKLRKAQQNVVNLRPYARKLLTMIADIAETQKVNHKLLAPIGDSRSVLLVVISSDKGLCGSFNSNINKFTDTFLRENQGRYEKIDLIFVGRRANDFFARKKIKPVKYMTGLDRDISYELAAKVAKEAIDQFKAGDYDEIRMVYNEFKSAICQEVTSERILPLDTKDINTFDQQPEQKFSKDLIFEPAPEQIIEELLDKHFAVQVYRCMSESVAAEHAARMTAMENSTKNAGDLIRNLTVSYNKLRQASITKELIEITTGAEALKG